MSPTNWKKVNEILEEVLAIDALKRAEFLENSGLERNVIEEVESLLAFEEAAESSMNLSAVEFSKDFLNSQQDNTLTGQQIGVYKIEKELGYGGMGAVYLASRTDGKFEQRVALKLLKREMNTAALRRRFQMEREILATLEHPNIARLLNAGTTKDKIPYIAMEYVEGLQIDDYCSKHDLDLDQRLNLFLKVCSAVDFAHRNLIVHRDLKPSNILVTEDGTPKLLDFGISKIISSDLGNTNTATVTQMGVMTPSYASPEQLKNQSVTTATDIYSLGVILYELLSGHRPFEEKEDDLKEIFSAVIENEPPLPSAINSSASKPINIYSEAKTKNEDINDDLEVKTKAHKTRLTKPLANRIKSNLLKGDLDNIILKALKKEPERRYSSAENFAEDIKRHQEGNPVTARPDTFSYRANKFIQRNRFAVAAGALIFLVVIGGIFATLWQARQTQLQAIKAQTEAEKTKKTLQFLENVLNFSNPYWSSSNPNRKKDVKVTEAMDEALENIEKDLGNEPEVKAEVLLILGKTYTGQGNYERSEEILLKSIKLFEQFYGINNSKTMKAKAVLADNRYLKSNYNEAEKLYDQVINYFRPRLSEEKENTKYLAIALTNLGNIYIKKGKFDESAKLNYESLELAKTLQGKDRRMIPIVIVNIAGHKFGKGDFKGALELLLEAQKEIAALGSLESLESGGNFIALGQTYTGLKEFELAEQNFQKGYETYLNIFGENDEHTTESQFRLAQLYFNKKEYNKCESVLDKSLKIQNEIFPNGHISIAYSNLQLGKCMTASGNLSGGEEKIREAYKFLTTIFKEPNPDLAAANAALGQNLSAQKRFVEARNALKSAYESYHKTSGDKHPNTKDALRAMNEITEKY